MSQLASHSKPGPGHDADRRCVVCRGEVSTAAALSLAAFDGHVVLASRGVPGGRAHVCLRSGCAGKLSSKVLSRALGRSVELPPPPRFWPHIAARARAELLSQLGLARRQGRPALGRRRWLLGRPCLASPGPCGWPTMPQIEFNGALSAPMGC